LLEDLIKRSLLNKYKDLTAHNPILLERHRSCINKIYLKTLDFSSKINKVGDVAILSSEVNILSYYLSDLVGIISPDDVLNSIFANFCIGK
jgi:tRNA modification GTPase